MQGIQMTPQQALEIVMQAAAQARLTWQEHLQVQQAAMVLDGVVNPRPTPHPDPLPGGEGEGQAEKIDQGG